MKNQELDNNLIYNQVANDYNDKWQSLVDYQANILQSFIDVLRPLDVKIKILDIGCGVGLDLFILNKYFDVYGIDISSEMCKYAQKNVPNAVIENVDFFEKELSQKFQGIVMDAYIHLFNKDKAKEILEKVKHVLDEGGFIFISTTQSSNSKEGFFEKEWCSQKVCRYRKFWQKQEFQDFLENCGFEIVVFNLDKQSDSDAVWMNIVMKIKS